MYFHIHFDFGNSYLFYYHINEFISCINSFIAFVNQVIRISKSPNLLRLSRSNAELSFYSFIAFNIAYFEL